MRIPHTRAFSIGTAIVVGVGVLLGGRALLERRALRRLSTAFADYERCFLGAPLAPGESAGRRAFHVHLAVSGAVATSPAGAPVTWPESCRSAADTVESALRSWFVDPEVWSRLRGPIEWASTDPATWDAPALELMDRQWALVPRSEMAEDARSTSSVEAPAPSHPPLELTPMGPGLKPRAFERDAVVTDPVAGETLRILLSEGTPDTLCIADPATASARCRTLPPPIVESLHPALAAMAEGAPLVLRAEMVGRPRRPGLFQVHEGRAELVEPTLFEAPPAFVDVGGDLVVVRQISQPALAQEYLVRAGEAGTALVDVRLDLPTLADLEPGDHIDVDLVRRNVLWARTRRGQAELFALPIPRDVAVNGPGKPHPPIGSSVRLGVVPVGGRIESACHDGEVTTVLWARGASAALLREERGAWSPPLPLSIGASARMTCPRGHVVVTSVVEADEEGRYVVRQSRCDDTCETTASEPLALAIDQPGDAIAATAGDRVAIVWRRKQDGGGRLAGVAFARASSLSSIHAEPDRPPLYRRSADRWGGRDRSIRATHRRRHPLDDAEGFVCRGDPGRRAVDSAPAKGRELATSGRERSR
jgi:hypothetical protein